MSTFANRLKRALEHAGKSRGELRAHLSISPQGMGQALSGTSGSLNAYNAAKAAQFLGVSVYWLCTGDGPMIEPHSLRGNRELPFRRIKHADLLRLKSAGKLGEVEAFMLGLLTALDSDDTKSRAS